MKTEFKLYKLLIPTFCLSLFLSCSAQDAIENKDINENKTEYFNNTTRGGLDGTIIKVTNLNASGEGSLRAALEKEGPRLVVFEVGGVIDLEMGRISIKHPNITIAGQTAPPPGITIIKGSIFVTTHDVEIQHIAVRPGDAGQPKRSGWEPDGISSYGENVHHFIVDHCSLSWAVDENLTASGPRLLGYKKTSNHVTFSNNIIAEALHNSSHAKGAHSKGTLIHDNCTEIAVVGNLYAHNADRNPYFKANTTGVIVNNLIYNPSSSGIRLNYSEAEWADASSKPNEPIVSIVGNVFYRGVDSGNSMPMIVKLGNIYLENNLAYDINKNRISQTSGSFTYLEQAPFWMEELNAINASETEDHILKNAGMRPAERDPIDQRIIQDFIAKKGKIIDSQDEVGGYPNYGTTYRKLDNPTNNIEEWLSKFTDEVEI